MLCGDFQRGLCRRGIKCSELHSHADRFTTISYGSESSVQRRDCRRSVSWDDEVTRNSAPSTPNKNKIGIPKHSPRVHVNIVQQNEPIRSSDEPIGSSLFLFFGSNNTDASAGSRGVDAGPTLMPFATAVRD